MVPGRAAQGHGVVARRRDPRAAGGHLVRPAGRRRRRHHRRQSVAAAEAELLRPTARRSSASIRRTIDRVREHEPSGPVAPYFCHTVCEIGADRRWPRRWSGSTPGWTAHPREVVVMFIQDTVTPQDTDAVLQRGRSRGQGLRASGRRASGRRCGEMIDSNKRLLVLMENHGGGEAYPYLHQGFDLVQDTEYTFDTAADFDCTLKRGQPDSPLLQRQPLAGQLHEAGLQRRAGQRLRRPQAADRRVPRASAVASRR